jgi:mannose-6-phosphate isomerase-like protein (cupin superfamily)
MLPGGRPAATATPLPAVEDDGRVTVVPAVRRGLDPESRLDNASNPSHETFRRVNAALRDDLLDIKQTSHTSDTRVVLNKAEIEDSERAAATVVAHARHAGITIGRVDLNDSGMIEVRGRTANGLATDFELAFGPAARIPLETSSAEWREGWYRELYEPARSGLIELNRTSETPQSPQALNNAAVVLAKAAETHAIPSIHEVARDAETGRLVIRMQASDATPLASVEVPESEFATHLDTVRRIDHPLHHRREEFQGLRAAVLDESERRGLDVTDGQAGNVAAFAIARAEQAGFPIGAIVLVPESRSVQVFAHDPDGKGFPDPSLVFPLDRAIATSILESSRTPPPIADRELPLAPRANASEVVSIDDPGHPCARDFPQLKEGLRDKLWPSASETEIGNVAAHILAESRVRGIADFALHHQAMGEVWVIESGRGDAAQRFKVGLEEAATIDMSESSRRWQEADRAQDIAPTLSNGHSQRL